MKSLTLEQLAAIPWNKKYITGPEVPAEPEIDQIHDLVDVPFMKRNPIYNLFYSWVEIINLVGDHNKPLKILDTCCGRGQVAQVLAYKGHKVDACDLSDDFCADRKMIEFKKTDLNGPFPYEYDSFDIALNGEGLEYLENTEHFLKEAGRILRPGGRLIISVPNIQSITGLLCFFRTGSLSAYGRETLPSRRNIIYLPLLSAQMEQSGFKIQRIHGNVPPRISRKVKIFTTLVNPFLFCRHDDIIKFSHSIIIESKKK